VIHIARVNVPSRDGPRRVDGKGDREKEGACTRTWNIEGGDGAVSGAHVPVIYATPVKEHALTVPAGLMPPDNVP
jgi:hypothetical protein